MKSRLLATVFCAASYLLVQHAVAAAAKPEGDVLLQGDQVDYDVNKQFVTAHGHVEVDYNGRILMTDKLTYDQVHDTMVAVGHVTMMDEKGNVAFASHATLSDKMRDGALEGFGALIGKNGRLAASKALREGGRYTTAYRAAYTACKICNKDGERVPVWQVRSYRIVYDQLKHRIRFHDATIDVFGVPVLYTPYMTQPDPTVRYASGLLTPDVGNSSSIGYFIRLPVYISLSPSQDATIEPFITTHGGQFLSAEYRERWMSGGYWLQGSVGYNPNGGISEHQHQVYSHLFGSGRLPLDSTWSTGFDAQLTSYNTYLKRYDISQLDRLTTDLFVQGESGRSRFAMTGFFFQGLRPTDDNKTFPLVMPLIEYTYIPMDPVLDGQFRFDFSSVALRRDVGTNDQRISAEARYRLPFTTGNGQLISLEADASGDVYHIDDVTPLPSTGHYVERGMPYLALDWRWPFYASARQGQAFILEPIGQVVLAPYGGNPTNLPNEDSVSVELDENNIFSFDQLPGRDLVQDGPRANAGMRAEALFPGGHVEAVIGESYRLKSDPTFSGNPALSGTSSDIVGRFSVQFAPYIDFTNRIDMDEKSGTIERNEIYLTGTYGRSSLQVSYVQLAPSVQTLGLGPREEINTQADVNFYRNFQAFAAIRRDLVAGEMLDTEFGLGYEDECLALAIAYRRKFTSEPGLPPSTAVILRIGLKTGDQPIQPFSLFHQDIFTYNHP